ncbi:CRP-like cAMP-binding protein [Modicisalibacter xianhensis]|uniref:CRP-like cAMP-binding protein n=1 Tax=Modicisalibacter xianhensis TaxID=442341 RepID=A0A4R8FS94_9GAMM|nr:Crp/Fnr family transcriptional regulator [Halomonas xianhensis]TDX26988.1 CRP-like cAMP-binding protein [Halomonas xianhensis]
MEDSCVIRNLSHFTTIGPEEARILHELELEPIKYKKDDKIWREGHQPDNIYTLHSGWAYTYQVMSNGKIRVLDIFLPGDIMGIRDATLPHHATSCAMLSSGDVCPLPAWRLTEIFHEYPNLAMSIHASSARQQAIITDRLFNVLSNDAKCRVAHFILEIYYRLKRVNTDLQEGFTLPLLQKHISLVLGLTHVHISRVLKEMEENNILKKARNQIEIMDIKKLYNMSNFDPERYTDAINSHLTHYISKTDHRDTL